LGLNYRKMSDTRNYILLKTFNNTSFEELVVARLRAENIDFRIKNGMSASIYPMANMGRSLEVEAADYELAIDILQQMEQDATKQPENMDFREADHADIEFEKRVYEQEQKLSNAKPPYLVFIIIILMCLVYAYFVTQMR